MVKRKQLSKIKKKKTKKKDLDTNEENTENFLPKRENRDMQTS